VQSRTLTIARKYHTPALQAEPAYQKERNGEKGGGKKASKGVEADCESGLASLAVPHPLNPVKLPITLRSAEQLRDREERWPEPADGLLDLGIYWFVIHKKARGTGIPCARDAGKTGKGDEKEGKTPGKELSLPRGSSWAIRGRAKCYTFAHEQGTGAVEDIDTGTLGHLNTAGAAQNRPTQKASAGHHAKHGAEDLPQSGRTTGRCTPASPRVQPPASKDATLRKGRKDRGKQATVDLSPSPTWREVEVAGGGYDKLGPSARMNANR